MIKKGCFLRTDCRLTCLGSELLGCRLKVSKGRKQEASDEKRLKLKAFVNNGAFPALLRLRIFLILNFVISQETNTSLFLPDFIDLYLILYKFLNRRKEAKTSKLINVEAYVKYLCTFRATTNCLKIVSFLNSSNHFEVF